MGEKTLQTNWFLGSILTELVLIFSLRTSKNIFKASLPSFPLLFLSVIAAAIAITTPYTNIGHHVFGFITPPVHELLIILTIVVLYLTATEIAKNIYFRDDRHLDLPPPKGEAGRDPVEFNYYGISRPSDSK